jgi:hypothetical protein
LEFNMGCGGNYKMESPTSPSAESEVNAWVKAMPQVYQTQMQYMLPLAQAQKSAQESLYPVTSGLQENLATQATQGMESGVPTWMQDQYKSNMNAQLGQNTMSPIGSDYMSRGLMQQQQDWKQYYQNLGLSLAGRQQLSSPNLEYMQNFSPNSVMSGMNTNYGTSASIYGSDMTGKAARDKLTQDYVKMGLNGSGSLFGSGSLTAAGSSSIRYKENVKLWE